MAKPRKPRAERIEDAELVGEVIPQPGVRVHAPPTPVHVAELVADEAPPPSPLAAVVAHLPPDLAAHVERWMPLGVGVLAAVRGARELYDEFSAPPRRRRLKR